MICAYGLWSDLRLSYFSPGWFGFSAANGGEPALSLKWNLGAEVLSGISGPLRQFFQLASTGGYDHYQTKHIGRHAPRPLPFFRWFTRNRPPSPAIAAVTRLTCRNGMNGAKLVMWNVPTFL